MMAENKQQIPHVIHYCWFGGKAKPDSVLKCIESWKKYCPDFEIKEWNESNYDVHKHPYMEKAYLNHRWAFVSDYARLDIMYENGGIYLDTDVEVIKDLSPLCKCSGYIGFETNDKVNDGQGFGCVAHLPVIKEMLDCYEGDEPYEIIDGKQEYSESPKLRTRVLLKHGLKLDGTRQQVADMDILTVDYLCPKDFQSGRMKLTSNTFSIHHFDGSWHGGNAQFYVKLRQFLVRTFGEKRGLDLFNRSMVAKDALKKLLKK